jgi:heptosyltransferase-3
MSRAKTEPAAILISRTDSIGDVMLTLPLTGVIRQHFPSCRIIFLGRSYTGPVIACCEHVDQFVNWDEWKDKPADEQEQAFRALNADAILHVFPDKQIAALAWKAAIPMRIGTSHRFFHLLTCNKRVSFTRKNSDLHEAQLNLKLLPALGITADYSLATLDKLCGFNRIQPLNQQWKTVLAPDKFNLILHPLSKGSAREWGIANFEKLLKLLPEDRFRVFVSGTREEGAGMQEFISRNPRLVNLCGKMNLEEFISFIGAAQGLVAASTGPLHIASAMGKKAIGIFAPMHPIHPGRWAPIGIHADYLVVQKDCSDCRKTGDCHCIREITPEQVLQRILK